MEPDLTTQYGAPAVVNNPVQSVYQPQTSNVYSPSNVQQTMTAPLPAPDYSDPFKLRDYFYNSPELTGAKSEVKRLTDEAALFDTRTDERQNFMNNQTLDLNVITGQKASDLAQRTTSRNAIERSRIAALSNLDVLNQDANAKYSIAEQNRSQIQDLIRQTGGKAGISYADNYESAIGKAQKYIEKTAKEEKKEAYKETLRAKLLELGKNTKGLSTKELEKKLKKYNKNALEEAKKLSDLEYQTKVVQLQKAKQDLSGDGDEVLSIADAKALEVPYGTTESEARGMGITPSSSTNLTAGQKTRLDAINIVNSQLDNYRKLYEQYAGFTGGKLTGSSAAKLRTAKSSLEFAIANAVGTGALQAADRAVVQDMIPDPTSLKSVLGIAVRGGKKGAISSLDEAKKIFDSARNTVMSGSPANINSSVSSFQSGLDQPEVYTLPDGKQYMMNEDGTFDEI